MIAARELPALGRRALAGWLADGGPTLGAALAFHALLALAPLLLVAVGIASHLFGRDAAQAAAVAQVAALAGQEAAHSLELFLDSVSPDTGLTPALVGAVAMLLGLVAMLAQVRAGLDRIWKCPSGAGPGPWHELAARAAQYVLLAAIAALLAGSVLAGAWLAAAPGRALQASPAALHLLDFAASFAGATLLFAALYRFAPTARVEWRDVALGAALAALLFWVGKLAVSLYLGTAALGSAFGAAGAAVVVALWVYWSANAFFLGAEVARHYALSHGSRRGEVAAAPTLAEMNAAYEELIERARRRAPEALS